MSRKAELVGALLVIARRDLHGVAGVAQGDEVDRPSPPGGGDIEAGMTRLARGTGYALTSQRLVGGRLRFLQVELAS